MSLEDVQREMVGLANALENTTEVWKLRLAINGVLDAYQQEAAKAFGLGILVGAGGVLEHNLTDRNRWGFP